MDVKALEEALGEKEALRYLLINWRATLLSMFAARIGDDRILSRAINRCTLILNMLESSPPATDLQVSEDILGQLALLISEIEYLVELKDSNDLDLLER